MARPVLIAAVFLISMAAVSPCAAGELDAIRQEGEISFAMTGQYPPFNFVDENNRLTGFDVEICTAIAGELGVKPVPVTTAWDGIAAGLLAGKYDLICGSMAITESRLKSIDFSERTIAPAPSSLSAAARVSTRPKSLEAKRWV